MQAVLRCDLNQAGEEWPVELLNGKVAGIRLLQRHLLGFREAGTEEAVVCVREQDVARLERILLGCKVAGLKVRVVQSGDLPLTIEPYLEQRADTVVDPRVFPQCFSLLEDAPPGINGLVCLDESEHNYETREKSPYAVGVPEKNEVTAVEDSQSKKLFPVGLQIIIPGVDSACRGVLVGRHYWHRIRGKEDFPIATWKVLLATMKRTDGVYARTNRRVSLRISAWLIDTPVTPNIVTLITLVCSFCAGLLFTQGSYFLMAAGGLVSWIASMLDGVDGELARSRFQASDFGCWLEMACDYLYYVFVFSGLGIGLYRASGNRIWFFLGLASVAGVLLSFTVIAWQRRRYARSGSASDFGLAWQKTVGRHATNPIYGLMRKIGFLATRAALPYYIAFFCFLGLTELLLILIALGTNLAWSLTLYSNRLFSGGIPTEG